MEKGQGNNNTRLDGILSLLLTGKSSLQIHTNKAHVGPLTRFPRMWDAHSVIPLLVGGGWERLVPPALENGK